MLSWKMLPVCLIVLLLVACEAVPEGNYNVYPADGQVITPATFEAQGRTFNLRPQATLYPTYTPYPTYTSPPEPTQENTLIPATTQVPLKGCVAAVQGSSQAIRGNHTLASPLVRWARSGERLDVLGFYIYEAGTDEWIKVEEGWVQVNPNVLIGVDDTLEICLDPHLTPTEYATPTSTPVPTAPATPLPTITPTGCQITATGNVNVRAVPGGSWVGLIETGTTTAADAKYTYGSLLYYRIFYLGKNAWAADYFNETAGCGSLPVVNPF